MREKTVSWLDSSAVLTLLYGEAGMDIVRELLEQSERDRGAVYLSAVTLTEVVSSLSRTHGESVARDELQVVLSLPAQIESASLSQSLRPRRWRQARSWCTRIRSLSRCWV